MGKAIFFNAFVLGLWQKFAERRNYSVSNSNSDISNQGANLKELIGKRRNCALTVPIKIPDRFRRKSKQTNKNLHIQAMPGNQKNILRMPNGMFEGFLLPVSSKGPCSK